MQRSVLSIGSFDGVHRGHRAIVAQARDLARSRRARVVVLTFDPHPARVLRPGAEPPRLLGRDEKIRRLRAAGADEVVVLEPTPALLGQTAEQFVQSLVERYHPVAFVEGPDFRFGKGRAGDMARLAELGAAWDFQAVTVKRVEVTLSDLTVVPVSSSLTRWLVGHGRVLDAAACLGQAFELTGPVVQGEQRGRQLGVPTANLDPEALREFIIPADAVYAGTVTVAGGQRYAAALSVGTKPTFGRRELAIEAHLLDFDGDLYGQAITVRFARWLRDQVWFPDIESLRVQIESDIAQTRRWHEQGLLTGDAQSTRAA